MTKAEKKKPAFQRWFKSKDWKKVIKHKVFGMTTSTGKSLCFSVPKGYTAELWAKDVKKRVGPFLKRSFPNRDSFLMLLDGEKRLHAPVAKAAFKTQGMKSLPRWPASSPDLNPQENVWSWVEDEIRRQEEDTDSFQDFQKKVLEAARCYPESSAKKLIPGMPKRIRACLEGKGAMTKY